MARGVPHDERVKAAVLAALATGCSVRSAARQHGVAPATVIAWRDAHPQHVNLNTVQPKTRDELGELVAEYMRASFAALTAQARLAADQAWITKQSAGELAIFHGVLFDKQLSLLERIHADRNGPTGADAGGGP
jgi:transposase-like protein